MKKLLILLVGALFLIATFACDGGNTGNGCDGPQTGSTGPHIAVPTCGSGVIDSQGVFLNDQQLAVNWTGPGAPTAPSNHPGFGEAGQPRPMNAYTWTMASFGDHLYAGIYNRLNDRQSETPDTSEGGEIWRYKPGPTVNSGVWEQEVAAGFGNPTNLGIRIMAVYNDQLFVGTHNLDQGAELWRRTNKDTAPGPGQWQVISTAGFGDTANNAVRSMAVFNGKLYLGTANNRTGAKLFQFDAATDSLSLVEKIGGTSGKANVVSELVPMGDYMWIFTWGGSIGLSAYRMDRQGNIIHANQVITDDTNNAGIISSEVYNGTIYLGTVNLTNGAQLFVLKNPESANINDVTWTRLGANIFQVTEKYLWHMQAFNGHLYIGTWNPYNSRAPLTSVNNIGATLYRMDQSEGFCQVMGPGKLIEEGFGQSENYGIRSMAEHNGRLYLGTAQPFKIEPGKNDTNAANRQGTEVWEFAPVN